MEQNKIVDTFVTSLMVNIWVEKYNMIVFMMVVIAGIYTQLSLSVFFEVLLAAFLFVGIVLMGFVAIAAHIQYYFYFERNRKVELYSDRIVISMNGKIVEQVFKNDIIEIIVHDRLRTFGYKSDGYDKYYNFYPSFSDNFYYLVLISKNRDSIILTCLLDVRLRKKIAAWYSHGLGHQYQFFPFPPMAARA